MKNKPSHFMISVRDMEESLVFYSENLGLGILYKTNEWSELAFGNVSLAIKKINGDQPTKGSAAIGFLVDDCEDATSKLEAKGIEIKNKCERREKDKVILTQFQDPDGNGIWLAQKIK